jgi:hypothetical protein
MLHHVRVRPRSPGGGWAVCAVRAVALASASFTASGAWAVPLLPDSAAAVPSEANPVGGDVLSTLTAPFSMPTYTGTVKSTVLRNDSSNPFGLDRLTFVYELTNDSTSTSALSRLTIDGFASLSTDVSRPEVSIPAVAPALMDRSVGAGDVIGFSFFDSPLGSGKIVPGTASVQLVIQTNALAYGASQASVINGETTMAEALGPVVPEPGAAVLSAIVVLGAALLGRTRWLGR